VLERRNHSNIAAAKNALKTSLAFTFEKAHFISNRKAFITGVVLSALVVAASSVFGFNQGEAAFLCLWLTLWSIGVVFLTTLVVKLWMQVFSGARSLGTQVGSIGAAVFMTLFALPFFGAEALALFTLAKVHRLGCASHRGGIRQRAFLSPAESADDAGRRILDKIEGFKMFLAATEADRLQRMYAVDRTPELYEKFLPYALALGVEQHWTEQFADVLSTAARPDGSGGYTPRWYTGSGWDSSRMSSFADSVEAH